jgi:hypothetical protein
VLSAAFNLKRSRLLKLSATIGTRLADVTWLMASREARPTDSFIVTGVPRSPEFGNWHDQNGCEPLTVV